MIVSETYDDLLSTQSTLSGLQNLASGFATLAGGLVNYNALKTQNNFRKLEAQSAQINTLEQINLLRQRYLNAVGMAGTNQARRNLKISSGNFRDNLEASSKALGADIQTMNRRTNLNINDLNASIQVNRYGLKSDLARSIYHGLDAGFTGFMDLYPLIDEPK